MKVSNILFLVGIPTGSAAAFFSNTKEKCMRVYHTFCGENDYFHTLKVLPGRDKNESDSKLSKVIVFLYFLLLFITWEIFPDTFLPNLSCIFVLRNDTSFTSIYT